MVESTVEPPETYRYAWDYPTGIETIFAVYNKYDKPADYRTLLHENVRIIVTQDPEMLAEVIVSVTDQETWQYDIQDALSVRLAHEGCPRLTGNFPLAAQLLEKYSTLIRNASLHSVVQESDRSNRPAYMAYIKVRR